MERSSALDQRHTSPGYGAHSHEFHGLCRNTDEGIRSGHSHQRSVWWYHQHSQRKGLDQCSTGMGVLLHNFYSNGAKTYEELNVYLETVRWHPTGRLWVDCFVKHTLLSLMFLPGDRNGDFLLQQHCLKAMLPYFFAAGHHNYARYLCWHVQQMEHLPQRTKEDLLAGAHVCRHSDGGTAVPADQFGEQTYIKRGKGSGGSKGILTSPEQVVVWVNSFSVCAHLDIAMEHMYNEAGGEQKPHGEVDGEEKNKHKEEGEGRRRLDEADRKKIAVELDK